MLCFGEEAKDGWITAEIFAAGRAGAFEVCKAYVSSGNSEDDLVIGSNDGFNYRADRMKLKDHW